MLLEMQTEIMRKERMIPGKLLFVIFTTIFSAEVSHAQGMDTVIVNSVKELGMLEILMSSSNQGYLPVITSKDAIDAFKLTDKSIDSVNVVYISAFSEMHKYIRNKSKDPIRVLCVSVYLESINDSFLKATAKVGFVQLTKPRKHKQVFFFEVNDLYKIEYDRISNTFQKAYFGY